MNREIIARIDDRSPGFVSFLETIWHFKNLVANEITTPVRIGWKQRWEAWRHGFLSETYLIRQLDTYDYQDFVSDYARYLRTPRINGPFKVFLNDKILFNILMDKHRDLIPETYGLILKGQYLSLGEPEHRDSYEVLLESIDPGRKLVIKPVRDDGGNYIFILTRQGDTFLLNGETHSAAQCISRFQKFHNFLVSEFVEQADYARQLFPETTNTIRFLVLWDPETNLPFIAKAAHRIGTQRSLPVDNFSKGGLVSLVDIETGILGPAKTYHGATGRVDFIDTHPDSGEMIQGQQVPFWPDISANLLSLATELPSLRYVGWDVIVTDTGFKIIEGNNYPGLNLFGPLLQDQRIRRFYQAHGVI